MHWFKCLFTELIELMEHLCITRICWPLRLQKRKILHPRLRRAHGLLGQTCTMSIGQKNAKIRLRLRLPSLRKRKSRLLSIPVHLFIIGKGFFKWSLKIDSFINSHGMILEEQNFTLKRAFSETWKWLLIDKKSQDSIYNICQRLHPRTGKNGKASLWREAVETEKGASASRRTQLTLPGQTPPISRARQICSSQQSSPSSKMSRHHVILTHTWEAYKPRVIQQTLTKGQTLELLSDSLTEKPLTTRL